MSAQQHSFVVRCWQLGSRNERIEIEHVQSGRKRLAHSTAEAIDWINGFGSAAQSQPTTVAPLPSRQKRVH